MNLRLEKEQTLAAWFAVRNMRVAAEDLDDHVEVLKMLKGCVAIDGGLAAVTKVLHRDLTLAQGLYLAKAVRHVGAAGGPGWPGDMAEHVQGLTKKAQQFVDVMQAKQEAADRRAKKGA